MEGTFCSWLETLARLLVHKTYESRKRSAFNSLPNHYTVLLGQGNNVILLGRGTLLSYRNISFYVIFETCGEQSTIVQDYACTCACACACSWIVLWKQHHILSTAHTWLVISVNYNIAIC